MQLNKFFQKLALCISLSLAASIAASSTAESSLYVFRTLVSNVECGLKNRLFDRKTMSGATLCACVYNTQDNITDREGEYVLPGSYRAAL